MDLFQPWTKKPFRSSKKLAWVKNTNCLQKNIYGMFYAELLFAGRQNISYLVRFCKIKYCKINDIITIKKIGPSKAFCRIFLFISIKKYFVKIDVS